MIYQKSGHPAEFGLGPIAYSELTSDLVDRLTSHQAEQVVVWLLAERACVKGQGKILSWSEFNENPDPLVNRLLAKILLNQISPEIFEGIKSENIAVLSIESSAVYLANQVAHSLEPKYRLERPPRLIRARRSYSLQPPSPAMGELFAVVTVFPITSGGEPRHLVASMPDGDDLKNIKILFIVDDFRATGNSLRGGVDLGLALLGKAGAQLEHVTVIPMSGLGKPDQETEKRFSDTGARILDVITAADVHFWGDPASGLAHIRANGFPPEIMKNASAGNFIPA